MARPRESIQGLKGVRLGPRPDFIPSPKGVKGARARGLAYEKKVGKEVVALYTERAEILLGQWIYFEDRRGPGVAQPDFLVLPTDLALPIVVGECKLTYREKAKEKLKKVYARLVAHLHPGRKLLLVQVCKHLAREVDYMDVTFAELGDLMKNDQGDGAYVVVHHI